MLEESKINSIQLTLMNLIAGVMYYMLLYLSMDIEIVTYSVWLDLIIFYFFGLTIYTFGLTVIEPLMIKWNFISDYKIKSSDTENYNNEYRTWLVIFRTMSSLFVLVTLSCLILFIAQKTSASATSFTAFLIISLFSLYFYSFKKIVTNYVENIIESSTEETDELK